MANGNTPYDSVPIPTYEEATSSRIGSSVSLRGPHEVSDDAERQNLLGSARPHGLFNQPTRRHGNYRAPTAESERSSYDGEVTSPDVSEDEDEDEGLRRDMEELEVLSPEDERRAQQRYRMRLPKSIANLRAALSSIHLPSFPHASSALSSITARLPTLPHHFHIGWPIIARLFGLFLIVALVYGLVVFRVLDSGPIIVGQRFEAHSVRAFLQDNIDPEMIEHYLRQVSFDDHLAGTKGDYFLAEKIEEWFEEANINGVFRDDYSVYLNYPQQKGRRVAIISPSEAQWEADLEEDLPTSTHDHSQHPSYVFHGHSKSGNVTGPLIYANYGSREDFAQLKRMGVNVTGSIVLVRYYGTQGDRALKVKAAELAGAIGCLIYSDPGDDGFVKGETWPDGPWRPQSSVQRGSVSLMSWVLGDVLTPGWSSKPGNPRVGKDNNPGLPTIPSLPLSWKDARVLIKSLKGKGFPLKKGWVGGVTDIDWWTGNSSSPTVLLQNMQDEEEMQPIRNIIGMINGVETPNQTVYIGNHRDAWCFGATDPGSGTAVFLEVVRVFGELMRHGWRPRRTIVFASWDAEEYNMIGSTEHVEEYLEQIRLQGVAYINLDTVVTGDQFWANASPLYQRVLLRALGRVGDPRANVTLKHKWRENDSKIGGLGAGSDYVAFQDLAGCSSIDLGFKGKPLAFPYHSCFDTFEWMKTMADPDFGYHAAVAQVVALMVLELADEAVLAFDFKNYAAEVMQYVENLKADAVAASRSDHDGRGNASKLNTHSLEKAAQTFIESVPEFEKTVAQYQPIPGMGESPTDAIHRRSNNLRMSLFETHLLDLPLEDEGRKGGIPGRNQFKHVIFGPQAWSGYDEAYFPAIRDAMDAGNWTAAQEQLEIVAKVLDRAVSLLLH